MSKRPPEMALILRVPHYMVKLWKPGTVFGSYNAPAHLAEHADAAIRSLRAKLFRERAKLHESQMERFAALAVLHQHIPVMSLACTWRSIQHAKADERFTSIADAIERGER